MVLFQSASNCVLLFEFNASLIVARPIINGKVEEKTAGEGPSLATMFEDDRHLQGIIQSIKVSISIHYVLSLHGPKY